MASESHAASGAVARRPSTGVWRGVALASLGALGAFAIAALDASPAWGVPASLPLLALAAAGVLDALGLFAPSAAGPATPLGETWVAPRPGEPRWAAPQVTLPLGLLVAFGGALVGGHDALPWAIASGAALQLPAALRRPALLVVAVGTLLFLPTLGVFGLWDPWETHYGEVAREILARNDWISLWWAQEDWFWSKPVLTFWTEAISMRLLGVDPMPDAHPAHPEWAIRLPSFVQSILALVALYAAVARAWGRRAGVLAALVLATCPHFFLLGRQAITDMAFVAHVTVAVSLLLLAVLEDPDREVRGVRLGRVVVSAQHVAIGGVILLVLPQAIYLVSRNVTLLPEGVAVHRDRFFSGSLGNTGVPGNAPAAFDLVPRVDHVLAQPAAQAVLWLALLAVVVWSLRRERRAQALLMVGFYASCALAFLGKGIPGFALPGLVALLFLVATGRWSLLLEGRLRVGLGASIVAAVGLPWFVAMTVRHGPPFLDRLLVHDHLKRLGSGVHGDKGSVEYFLEQLGYATFPWAGLAVAAVVWLTVEAARRRGPGAAATREEQDAHAALVLVVLWFASTFTLFSAMVTKFHHYIFPAVPPLAVLAALLLDRLAGAHGRPREALGRALAGAAAVPAVLGVAGLWGDVRGVVPEGLDDAAQREWVLDHPWSPALSWSLVALGVLLFAAAVGRERAHAEPGELPPRRAAGLFLPALVVLALVVVAFVGRDLAWTTLQRPAGNERLVRLFIYNYDRDYPGHLDYRAALTGFAVVAGAVYALLALPVTRRAAVSAAVGLGLAFAAWTVNVYMLDLSPHWSQRALIDRYYADRRGPEEPLVAWQMNWKGENFYTGNRVHAFVDLDNDALRDWMRANEGKTAYFLMEHGRVARFRSLVRGEVAELSTPRDNNKFMLVRTTL